MLALLLKYYFQHECFNTNASHQDVSCAHIKRHQIQGHQVRNRVDLHELFQFHFSLLVLNF